MTHFLINALIYFLETIFAVGIIGSAVVVVLTTIEDAGEVFEKDMPLEPAAGLGAPRPEPTNF